MKTLQEFYNNQYYNNLIIISIDDEVFSLKEFEKKANSTIKLTRNNLFQYFIYLNFFSGRFNSKKYSENLNLVNKVFFEVEDYLFSYKGFLNNKVKYIKFFLNDIINVKSGEQFEKPTCVFIANSEKFLNQQVNIGIKFDEIFKNYFERSQKEDYFDEIVLNDIIYDYISRINYLTQSYYNVRDQVYKTLYSNDFSDTEDYKEFLLDI